jgi:hypothetical protein
MSFHGKKRYLQLLLDPYRTKLLEDIAEKRGMRVTAFVRELVYKYLQIVTPETAYQEMADKDAELWRESVERQAAGRAARSRRPEVEEED